MSSYKGLDDYTKQMNWRWHWIRLVPILWLFYIMYNIYYISYIIYKREFTFRGKLYFTIKISFNLDFFLLHLIFIYLFLLFGPHLSMFRLSPELCPQELLLGGARGTIWRAGDWTRACCMQGKYLAHCTSALHLAFRYIWFWFLVYLSKLLP